MELHNSIINDDCYLALTKFPKDFIDLVVTSPPYDNLRDYNGYDFSHEKLIQIIKELHRVLKVGGVVVWVIGDSTINGSETGSSFRQALEFMNNGFKLHDTMIYEKIQVHFQLKEMELDTHKYLNTCLFFVKEKLKRQI